MKQKLTLELEQRKKEEKEGKKQRRMGEWKILKQMPDASGCTFLKVWTKK